MLSLSAKGRLGSACGARSWKWDGKRPRRAPCLAMQGQPASPVPASIRHRLHSPPGLVDHPISWPPLLLLSAGDRRLPPGTRAEGWTGFILQCCHVSMHSSVHFCSIMAVDSAAKNNITRPDIFPSFLELLRSIAPLSPVSAKMAGDRSVEEEENVPCIGPRSSVQAAFDWRRDRGWLSLSGLDKAHTPPQNTASTAIRPKKHFVHQFGTNSPTRHQASPRRSLHALFQKHRKHPVHPIRPIHPTHPAHPTPSPRKRPDDPFATRRETRRPSLPQFSGRMVNPHGNTMSPGCLSLTKLSEISSSSASSTTRMSLDALRP